MSGAAPDRTPADAASERRDAKGAKIAWWKKVVQAYQGRPLLYGFFTVLGLVLLAAVLSPFFSATESILPVTSGPRRTPAAQLQAIAENLRRMDEFGQAAYAELLRDSLNPWMRLLKPTGTWQPDSYLVALMPQVREAALEQQRLRGLIAEKEKQLASKQGPTNPAEVAKERTALVELRRQAQALESGLGQFRQQAGQELAGLTFSLEDALVIEGAVWSREISNRVRQGLARRRGKVESLELAQELFDWTIRNIALDERDQPTTELAWESLLWGRASNPSRAWVFLELCRQQGLDAVMLGYRDPKGSGTKDWIPAVLVSKDSSPPELCLFDHRWGIPIPGPGGRGVATLAQAKESPDVLSQLDGVRAYPVRASDLRDVVARLDISPHLLSRRMQILEGELRGADHVVLTAELSKLASRLQKAKGLAAIEAWPWPGECLSNSRQVPPAALRSKFAIFALHGVEQKGRKSEEVQKEHKQSFPELAAMEAREKAPDDPNNPEVTLETVQREQREKKVPGFLWRGRMLQFRGIFVDAEEDRAGTSRDRSADSAPRQGAPNVYQSGRMTDRELDDWRTRLTADLATLQALRSDREKKGASAQQLSEIDFAAVEIQSRLERLPAVRLERQFVRLVATYFLAHIAYERGNYSDAVEYFRFLHETEGPALLRVVEAMQARATQADQGTRQIVENVVKPMLSIWTTASNYNLARSLEAAGRYAEAIDAYRADTSADQRPGSLYRAKRLEQELAEKAKAADKKATEGKKPSGVKSPDAKSAEKPAAAEAKSSPKGSP